MAMMKLNRRQLLTASLASLICLSQSVRRSLANPAAVLKPPRLKAGVGVGLISPAGATFLREEVEIVY